MQSKKISKKFKEKAKTVGIDFDPLVRSGTYVHQDNISVLSEIATEFKGKVEIMDTRRAERIYPWVSEYSWKLISPDQDEYTQQAHDDCGGGYFIWVKKGVKLDLPIQSCIAIKDILNQKLHNIIIIEEGAKANIITGCFKYEDNCAITHIGCTEFFVAKNAYLNFTMIHNWKENSFVRPRGKAKVGKDGTFVSNYILTSPVKDIQMNPIALLEGENSRASLTSLLFGQKNSKIDIGGRVELIGNNSCAEIHAKAIASDSSSLFSRGTIIGNNSNSKGHLECRGLMLLDSARITAIPELIAQKMGAQLSHEAAIGKISQEEITYLMSRGLSEEKANSVIIRGFLDTKILGLPKELTEKIKDLIKIKTSI